MLASCLRRWGVRPSPRKDSSELGKTAANWERQQRTGKDSSELVKDSSELEKDSSELGKDSSELEKDSSELERQQRTGEDSSELENFKIKFKNEVASICQLPKAG